MTERMFSDPLPGDFVEGDDGMFRVAAARPPDDGLLDRLPPVTCCRTHIHPDEGKGVFGAVWLADVKRALAATTEPRDEGLREALEAARREVAHRFDQGPCMGPRQGCAACTIDAVLAGSDE